jgi:MFS superfamily sulfate permease-like transporter
VIDGPCSFLPLPRLNSVLSSVPAGSHVTIDLAVNFFDHPAYETLSAWRRQHESTGGTVQIDAGGAATLEVAAALPPRRNSSPFTTRVGLAPWKAGQGQDRGGANSYAHPHPHPLNPVIHGIDGYHRRHAALVRPHMQEVARDALRNGHPVGEAARNAGFNEVDQLDMVNVAVQLQNLQRHPMVGPAVATSACMLLASSTTGPRRG